jgi:hypothetical protein
MTDYMITNSATLLGGVEDASVAGSFDPAFADHALRFTEDEECAIELPGLHDVWVQATLYFDGLDRTSNGDGYFWTVAAPTLDLVMIDLANGNMTMDFATAHYTTPYSTGPQANSVPNQVRFILDAHVETGSAIFGNPDEYRVSFYINGGLLAQVQTTANTLNDGAPTKLALGGFDFLDGNARYFVSNVRVSDQDTRGRRFRFLRPTGPGTLATAAGGYAELGDNNPASFAFARAAGEAVTSTLTPGATPGGTIGTVKLVSYARNAVPNPDPGQVINRLRIGGTDYDAAGQAPSSGAIEPLISEWSVNPATGQPWEWADLTGLEIGFAGGT